MNPIRMDVTTELAIYGALVSTFALGWNTYRDLRDRAKLKVSARISRLTVDGQGRWLAITSAAHAQALPQHYIVMTVANVGRRPVVWQGWGGRYHGWKNKQFFIADQNLPNYLPKRLEEGDSHTACTELTNFENVRKFFMWDASGKKWKVPRRELKKLKKEAEQIIKTAPKTQ